MKKNTEKEIVSEGKLNEVKVIKTKRTNGSVRIQQNFEFCPSMAEQHSAHMTDINWLIDTYKPDELAAYIAAKNQSRHAINNLDLSKEPDLEGARNMNYRLQQHYENLPEHIKTHFKNHIEFIKFVDNPDNAQKLIKLGLMKREEIQQFSTDATTTTKEAKAATQQNTEASS